MEDQNSRQPHSVLNASGEWITKALDDAINHDPRALVMALGGIQQALVGIAVSIGSRSDQIHIPTPDTIPDDIDADPNAEVRALAEVLWAADPSRTGAAGTFDEDYAVTQDRYLVMAIAALNSGEDGTR